MTPLTSMGTEVPVLQIFADLTLYISSSDCTSMSFIIFFNKLVNVSVSLTSESHSSKLLEAEEEVMGTPDL